MRLLSLWIFRFRRTCRRIKAPAANSRPSSQNIDCSVKANLQPGVRRFWVFSNPRSLRLSTSQWNRNSRLMTEADGTPTVPRKAAPRTRLMPKPIIICARSTQQDCLHSPAWGPTAARTRKLHSAFPSTFANAASAASKRPGYGARQEGRNQRLRISIRPRREPLLAT